jgi:hypothetical protein
MEDSSRSTDSKPELTPFLQRCTTNGQWGGRAEHMKAAVTHSHSKTMMSPALREYNNNNSNSNNSNNNNCGGGINGACSGDGSDDAVG